MNLDKAQILDLLRGQGKHDQAADAEQELPDQVDTDNDDHKSILSRLGVDPGDLPGGLGKLL